MSRRTRTPIKRKNTLEKAKRSPLKIKVIIHQAEEGGFWAEVPALPGCFTEGDSRKKLVANLREAIEGILLGPDVAEPLGEKAHAEEIEF